MKQNPKIISALKVLLKIYDERVDLQKNYPEVRNGDLSRLINWAAGVSMRKWKDSSYTILQPFAEWYLKNIIENKLNKFHKIILPLLKCIKCSHEKLQINNHSLKCKKCSQIYPVYNGIPVMTLDPNKSMNFDKSVMVSHRYSDQWMKLIKNARNELVLDLGSGNNPEEFENVVKFDTFCFSNVNVVGDAESLPFKDESFRIVMSGAVLEHIRDIKAATRNIFRVLKPTGEVYIETAFLQPMHAFPDHYYNMTVRGIENLFSDFEKIDSGTRKHQYPSFAIKWILQSWASKIPPEERKEFLNSTVKDIIKEYTENPYSKKWLNNFKKHELEELAAGVYYYGKKKKSR